MSSQGAVNFKENMDYIYLTKWIVFYYEIMKLDLKVNYN